MFFREKFSITQNKVPSSIEFLFILVIMLIVCVFGYFHFAKFIPSSKITTLWTFSTGDIVYSSPARDIDNDGKLEVVIGSVDY